MNIHFGNPKYFNTDVGEMTCTDNVCYIGETPFGSITLDDAGHRRVIDLVPKGQVNPLLTDRFDSISKTENIKSTSTSIDKMNTIKLSKRRRPKITASGVDMKTNPRDTSFLGGKRNETVIVQKDSDARVPKRKDISAEKPANTPLPVTDLEVPHETTPVAIGPVDTRIGPKDLRLGPENLYLDRYLQDYYDMYGKHYVLPEYAYDRVNSNLLLAAGAVILIAVMTLKK